MPKNLNSSFWYKTVYSNFLHSIAYNLLHKDFLVKMKNGKIYRLLNVDKESAEKVFNAGKNTGTAFNEMKKHFDNIEIKNFVFVDNSEPFFVGEEKETSHQPKTTVIDLSLF